MKDHIDDLLTRLASLSSKQEAFSKEIRELRQEIEHLKDVRQWQGKHEQHEEVVNQNPQPTERNDSRLFKYYEEEPFIPPVSNAEPAASFPKINFNLEKFIGENLINKIGIIITVIGVAIGAKYSIDHNLISPVTRIIMGYIAGIALLAFGMKLKEKYENFSAVLVSGAMAVMYFITFSAYSFYNLLPQVMAFALMVIFTSFTVFAALRYNRQIIALIGLVGAYAVPFLLSDGSGRVAVLFSYVTIINSGILILSFKKNWKALYYAAFIFSWLIFGSWFVSMYRPAQHFGMGFSFLAVFFSTFYITFLAHKIIRKEKFEATDVMLLISNSFLFYGIGYAMLNGNETGSHLLGLFTLLNAFIHFGVSWFVFTRKLADKNIFYLLSGMVLVFITITIPVQLNGNWVTLLWAGEAALLFWIGRTKSIAFYEKLSYLLMMIASLSILQDWMLVYARRPHDTHLAFLSNIQFLSSLLFVAAFGFINYVDRKREYPSAWPEDITLARTASLFMGLIFFAALFISFATEIGAYWDQRYAASWVNLAETNSGATWDEDLRLFKYIWLINYSMGFFALVSFFNLVKLKDHSLAIVNLVMNVATLIIFLAIGLYTISELRESYLDQRWAEYYRHGIFNIIIRYVSFGFFAITLFATWKYLRSELIKNDFNKLFELLLHTSILWISSSELIHWLDMAGTSSSYKLGLSILWGVYSLVLIGLGIWKSKQYLRIGAIALFGVTLLKLFFYDIAQLNTIAKTVVFVSLGVLLLIISFLYHKYKNLIAGEAEN